MSKPPKKQLLRNPALTSLLKTLPLEPGVYKMLDQGGVVIYVGKAKHLKKRVNSYFNKTHDDPKTNVLVSKVHHIEVTITQSEHEALVLERQLIRELKPRYNIALKDDKSYPYIKLTNEPFPRLMVVREKKNDGAQYFGPYTSVGSSKYLQRTLFSLFPIRDCKQFIDPVKKQKKCIQLDLGNCIGPCIYKETKAQYSAYISQLADFLGGRSKQLIRRLKAEMQRYSDARQYEKAAALRDRLTSMIQLQEKQVVDIQTKDVFHLWSAVRNDRFYYVLVQRVIQGQALYMHGFYNDIDSSMSLQDFLSQCLIEFLTEMPETPQYVICEAEIAMVVEEHIEMVLPKHLPVKTPVRGPKRDMMDMVNRNARLALKRLEKTHATQWDQPKQDALLADVQDALRLERLPKWMIGFDISHTQGANIVASAVSFKDGMVDKAGYRKFAIRTVQGQSDDPASMYEVVQRRLQLCDKEKTGYPQLLVIDGGLPQLNFAWKAVSDLGLLHQVEIVALAKREEQLWRPKWSIPLVLSKADPVLQLFQRVRDESHRFANTFQRTKRAAAYKSQLEEIPGLGPKRIQTLYKTFKTVAAMQSSSPQELSDLLKISLEKAAPIFAQILSLE